MVRSLSKTWLKVLTYCIFIFLFLYLSIIAIINTPSVQTIIVKKSLAFLNKKFGVSISVKHISINFLGDLYAKGIKVLDHHKNTLIYVNNLKGRTKLIKLVFHPEQIYISDLKIYSPVVNIVTYYGEKKSNIYQLIEKLFKQKQIFSKTLFKKNIEIKNGYLAVFNHNLKSSQAILLNISNIMAKVQDLNIQRESVSANLCYLQSRVKYHQSVFELVNFSTKASFSPKSLILEKIDIKTSKSVIKGSLNLNYENIKDFKHFNEKVHINSKILPGSKLGAEDLRLFIDLWPNKSKIEFSGKILGKLVEELVLTDVQFQCGSNKIISDKINIFKITSLKNFFITQKKGFISTSYNGLRNLLSDQIAIKFINFIKNYGKLSLYGGFYIDYKKVKAEGTLRSETIGSVHIKVELNEYRGNSILYKGKIAGDKLHIAYLTNNKNLQSISGILKFEGTSLNIKDLKITFKGIFSEILLYDQLLHNLYIDGELCGLFFNGTVDINDIKGKIHSDGEFNFSQKNLMLNAKINIENLDLKALKLTKQSKSLISTKAQIQLSGLNINDIEGSISMYQSSYKTDKKTFKISKIKLKGIKEGDKRTMILEATDMIKGEITGNMPWHIWPRFIKSEIQYIINKQRKYIFEENNYLAFKLKVKSTFIEIFSEDFSLPSTNEFFGKIGFRNNIKLNFRVEKIKLKDIIFEDIKLTTDETISQYLQLKVGKITLKRIILKELLILGFFKERLLKINSSFVAQWEDNKEQRFELNFYKKGNWGGERCFSIGLLRSKVSINGLNWWINEKDDTRTHKIDIDLNKNTFLARKIEFTASEGQHLELSIVNFKNWNYKLIQGKINNVQIKRVLPKKYKDNIIINGLVNGNFSIDNFNNILKPNIKLNISKIYIGNKVFESMEIASYYIENNKDYLLKGKIKDKGTEILDIYGIIKNKNPEKTQLDLTLTSKGFPFSLIEGFLGDIFSDVHGSAQGEIKITGSFENPVYEGTVKLHKAGFKIIYLNTAYKLIDEPILRFSANSIKLENFCLKDLQYKTQARLRRGELYLKDLKWNLNLSIESEYLLLFNTSSMHNNSFYGTLFITSMLNKRDKYPPKLLEINILGEADNIKIQVKNAKIVGPSRLYININKKNKDTKKNPSYIEFIDIHKMPIEGAIKINRHDISIENNKNKKFYVEIETFIDPDVYIKLLMDKYGDNSINVKGEGMIRLKISPDRDLQISGSPYEIVSGIYQFSIEQIPFMKLDRKFNIKPKGLVIWGETINDATLNIQASYSKIVSNVSEYLHLDNTINISNLLTELNIYISGNLLKPKIKFEIKFPDASEDIRYKLFEQLNTDNKIFIQFSSILLFGKFFLNTKDIVEDGLSSAYDIVLKQLGTILSRIYDSLSINLEYIQGNNRINTSNSFNSSISYDINKIFNIKGTFRIPLNTIITQQELNAFRGDIQLNIDISKASDKSLVLTLFSKPKTFVGEIENIEPTTYSSQTYGTGIIYTTKFDSFKQFIQKYLPKRKSKISSKKIPIKRS